MVLAQVYLFLKQVTDEDSQMPAICYKYKTEGYKSLTIHKFNAKEREFIAVIANSDEVQELAKEQSSAVIQALELMRIWVSDIPKEHRPKLAISDKKLLMGKNHYITDILKLKQVDEKRYKEVKEIMNKSIENTQKWYNIVYKMITERYPNGLK